MRNKREFAVSSHFHAVFLEGVRSIRVFMECKCCCFPAIYLGVSCYSIKPIHINPYNGLLGALFLLIR